MCFSVCCFQSTLRVEHKIEAGMADATGGQAGPQTKGLVLHWAAGYDLLAWLVLHGKERAFRERLLALAAVDAGESVLDIGCGTGTLAIAAAVRVALHGSVFAIDASPEMIARARRKAAKARVQVTFELAPAEQLPFSDGRFDVVLSTLMLHHLPHKTRQQCAREVRRVLKPGGRVLVVDFGQPQARHGLLAHFHRHGHVAMEDIVATLVDAGLHITRTGAVGIRDLQFVLATTAG
jgi:ubiquinone/menaquinone biosynthesis C-methylase UbiE